MRVAPGRIVLYTLTEADAQAINKRRADFTGYQGPDTGHQGHWGPKAHASDTLPAIVVRGAWMGGKPNLQVFLDGNDTFYVSGADHSDFDTPGAWSWPKEF